MKKFFLKALLYTGLPVGIYTAGWYRVGEEYIKAAPGAIKTTTQNAAHDAWVKMTTPKPKIEEPKKEEPKKEEAKKEEPKAEVKKEETKKPDAPAPK